MEKEQDNKDWGLVHNDNGEWINEKNVEYLSPFEVSILQIRVAEVGRKLSVQHGHEGSLWCYKKELEEIESLIQYPKVEKRTLRIKKS